MTHTPKQRLHAQISGYLTEVASLFSVPVKITIVVRDPTHPDGTRNVKLTNDSLEEAIAALRELEISGEVVR